MTARCEGGEVHVIDFGVGPAEIHEVACEEDASFAVTFEMWDPVAERPTQETVLVCLGHLDEESVSGVMYHVRTEELFEEVGV